ncbi:hypothetical protein HMPREF3038_01952 [Akkermansia sp. KLE1797]|nr:hypothetical protein HMPREF3038_01952 [Akkermansia sp. KLE1797]KZA06020.1 hypothetical protein HMPREF1326_00284 [Akkermansia sp. KLE1605]
MQRDGCSSYFFRFALQRSSAIPSVSSITDEKQPFRTFPRNGCTYGKARQI